MKRGGHACGQEQGQVVPIPATVREAKFKGTDWGRESKVASSLREGGAGIWKGEEKV